MNGTTPLDIKHHSLTGRITPEMMQAAFKAVARNKGAPGIDRMTIEMFKANKAANLDRLRRELKTGTYRPQPVRRTFIAKGNGKKRPLGIPCVRDRVAQEVLRQLLMPLFEPLFHDHSFGFRPKRSCHDAVRKVVELHRSRHCFVLDADVSGFFDNIPHSVIMRGLRNVVADGNVLNLVERVLTAGVSENGVIQPTTVGTPQGGVASPLLANIALNFLDWQLDEAGYQFVRYADDFVVLCRSKRRAEEAHGFVRRVIASLGLELSEEKTVVASFKEGFTFLGFDIHSYGRRMRSKSVENFKAKIRSLTVRKHNLDAETIRNINAVIRGVGNYFGADFATVAKQFYRLDQWVRMRLRCMKYERIWHTDNYKLKNTHLQHLGLIALRDSL